MKNFTLYKVVGFKLDNESLIKLINENAYSLDEFTPQDLSRDGFTPIHRKLENLYVDGQGFVKAKFKVATRKVNKTVLSDMVKQKMKEQKERGIIPNRLDIESAVHSKLKPFAEIKISEFDIIFDTKNDLIYTSAKGTSFEEKIIPLIRDINSDIKFRPFKTRLHHHLLANFFLAPEESLTEQINIGTYVEIMKDDESIVTFQNTDLKNDNDVQVIINSSWFQVNQIGLKLTDGNFVSYFRIDKKFTPTGIKIYGVESDSDMSESADMADASNESNANLSKEEILFDNIYTNTIIEMDALLKIAKFTMNFDQMDELVTELENNK